MVIYLKKINSLELSFLLVYIFQAYFYIIFLNKAIDFTSYNFIFYFIISIFLGISIILLFNYLFNLSNKNIFFNIKNKFLIFILIFVPFVFACFSLDNISSYINNIYLKDVDNFFISIPFIIVIYFIIKKDIFSFFRCSSLIFYFYIILEIVTVILLAFYFDFNNILPINYDIENAINNSYLFIIFLIMPILFLLVVPKEIIRNNNKINKKVFISYIIIVFLLLIKSIISISILGYSSISIYNYPDIIIYKNINLFSLIERMEWLLCFNSITNMFFLISLSLLYVKEGLNYLIPSKKLNKLSPFIICLIVLLCSYFLVVDYIYIVYLFCLFFFIHLIFCIYKLIKQLST